MIRDGQVWLDHNDDRSAYVVISGPHYREDNVGNWAHYKMLDIAMGTLCEWSVDPSWEKDHLLTRIA